MADAPRKKKWIKGAIKHPGALHRHLGIPEGEKIPEDRLRAAANSKDPAIRREANFAMTLKGFHHPKKKAARTGKERRHAMYGSKE